MQATSRNACAMLGHVGSLRRAILLRSEQAYSASPLRRGMQARYNLTSATASTSSEVESEPRTDGTSEDPRSAVREEAKRRIRGVMRAGAEDESGVTHERPDSSKGTAKASAKSSKKKSIKEVQRSPIIDPEQNLLSRKQIEKLRVIIRDTLNSPKYANPWIVKGKRQLRSLTHASPESHARLLHSYKFHVGWQVEALGAYRRGAEQSRGVFLCYMDSQQGGQAATKPSPEERALQSTEAREGFRQGQILQRQKELAGVSEAPGLAPQALLMAHQWVDRELHTRAKTLKRREGHITLKVPQARIPLEIHVVEPSSLGTARLLLTGNEHYARFLTLTAEEGMGLRLDKHGLWHHPALSEQARAAKSGVSSHSSLFLASDGQLTETSFGTAPQTDAQASVEEEQRDASSVKAKYNASMGLPANLDSSLDLGASPQQPSNPSITPTSDAQSPAATSAALSDAGPSIDLADPRWKRIGIGASEAEILDILGLAYLEPSQRDIKGPGEEEPAPSTV